MPWRVLHGACGAEIAVGFARISAAAYGTEDCEMGGGKLARVEPGSLEDFASVSKNCFVG